MFTTAKVGVTAFFGDKTFRLKACAFMRTIAVRLVA